MLDQPAYALSGQTGVIKGFLPMSIILNHMFTSPPMAGELKRIKQFIVIYTDFCFHSLIKT